VHADALVAEALEERLRKRDLALDNRAIVRGLWRELQDNVFCAGRDDCEHDVVAELADRVQWHRNDVGRKAPAEPGDRIDQPVAVATVVEQDPRGFPAGTAVDAERDLHL